MSRSARLVVIITITLAFFFVEFLVGNYTKSLSLTADSFNMLSDIISQVIGLVAIRINKKPNTRSEFTYGWARAEILGAIVNCVFQLGLCFTIIVDAVRRFISPEAIENPKLVLWIGIAGFCVNCTGLILCIVNIKKWKESIKAKISEMRSRSNSNSSKGLTKNIDGDSLKIPIEDDTHSEPRPKEATMNMSGVLVHILGDALGSVGVTITALFTLYTDIPHKELVDPITSLVLVAVILGTTMPLLKQSSLILLQTAPQCLNIEKLRNQIKNVQGVIEIHNFHIWQLNELENVGTVHVVCDSDRCSTEIKDEIKMIMNKNDIMGTTIQTETKFH
jgi:zinc transporter 1